MRRIKKSHITQLGLERNAMRSDLEDTAAIPELTSGGVDEGDDDDDDADGDLVVALCVLTKEVGWKSVHVASYALM